MGYASDIHRARVATWFAHTIGMSVLTAGLAGFVVAFAVLMSGADSYFFAWAAGVLGFAATWGTAKAPRPNTRHYARSDLV